MPFTGDSSDDSSDGEEPHSMSVTAQNTPHHTYSKLNVLFLFHISNYVLNKNYLAFACSFIFSSYKCFNNPCFESV